MLKDQINSDLKTAMLSGDKARAEVLKLSKSAMLYKEVELGLRESGLSDEQAVEVLSKEAKKRLEAAEMYDKAGRSEQAAAERFEHGVISEYLPAQASDDEIVVAVDAAIAESGAVSLQDMGKVIGAVKAKLGQTADGSRIASVVKNKLS